MLATVQVVSSSSIVVLLFLLLLVQTAAHFPRLLGFLVVFVVIGIPILVVMLGGGK